MPGPGGRGGGAWSWGRGVQGPKGGLLWGCLVPGGVCSGGGRSVPRGVLVETPWTATAAGGMHPTGMHSCLPLFLLKLLILRKTLML